jgi:type I restriction enzyme S subunit
MEHLDLLATAPGGVGRLRELILTLAVQGKLVAQEAGDEPAGVLLEKIRAEKERLVAEGGKRGKAAAPIVEDETPFALPGGWAWTRLEMLSTVIVDCPHSTPKFVERGRLCLDTNCFKQGRLIPQKLRFVDDATFGVRVSRLVPVPGDLVFAREGSVGESIIIPPGIEACLGQRVMLFRFSTQVSTEYVRLAISSAAFLEALLALHKGIGAKHVNVGDMRMAVIPLPPLAEQSRIVARVEELMRLCDALEAKGRLEAAQHAQLLSTLLGSLTNCRTPEELTKHWQRVATHFDLLLDRPEAVDALEQTILQLAVRGLLVSQDAADEPASVLLQRVRTEKERWVTEGRVKRDKPVPSIEEHEFPFCPPVGWTCQRIDTVAEVLGGIQKTQARRPAKNHYPYLRVANVQRDELRLDEIERFEITREELAKWQLKAGDLLVVEGNGSADEIGRCAVWRGAIDPCVYQNHLIRVRCFEPSCVAFLKLYLNSPSGAEDMKRLAITTSGLYNLSVGKIRNFVVPLPPLAEQARIVARVESLSRLCADLRQQLSAAQATQSQLAEALVAQPA